MQITIAAKTSILKTFGLPMPDLNIAKLEAIPLSFNPRFEISDKYRIKQKTTIDIIILTILSRLKLAFGN
jgi:hypothetical protein